MPLTQLRNTNLGKSKADLTGSTGVGFTVLDTSGAVIQTRTTASVYQLTSGSGLYAALVTFPDNFRGQIMWDSGEVLLASRSYAVEQYNYEENNPLVDQIYSDTQFISGTIIAMSGSLEFVRDMTEGRWHIVGNQMIFYAEDNLTEVARFDLFDQGGSPTMDTPFERRRV